MKSQKFNVTGMTCSACSARIEKDIIKVVQDTGYGASSAERKKDTAAPDQKSDAEKEFHEMKKRLLISFIFAVPLLYLAMGHMLKWPLPDIFHGEENAMTFAFTQFLLALPVMIINKKYYTVGFKTLFKGSPNMDSLIAIGTTAAVGYGIFAIYKIGYG